MYAQDDKSIPKMDSVCSNSKEFAPVRVDPHFDGMQK